MTDTETLGNQHELEWLSKVLNVSGGKLSYDSKEKIPVLKTASGTSIRGFITVAKYLAQLSKQNHLLCGNDAAETAAISQWLEYRQNCVDRSEHEKDVWTVLKDINCYLADKVYFVGHRLSLADILLYCGLYRFIKDMAFNDKQTHVHLCRWFNNVQHQISHPKQMTLLHFQKNKLYSDLGH